MELSLLLGWKLMQPGKANPRECPSSFSEASDSSRELSEAFVELRNYTLELRNYTLEFRNYTLVLRVDLSESPARLRAKLLAIGL